MSGCTVCVLTTLGRTESNILVIRLFHDIT